MYDSSKIRVYRLALDGISGSNTIVNSVNDKDPITVICNRNFELALRTALIVADFSFAIKTVNLAQKEQGVENNEAQYPNMFVLPKDCLKIVQINDSFEENYKIENGTIITSSESVKLRYVFYNDNPESWTPPFYLAVCTLLSSRLAIALNNDAAGKERLRQEYEQYISGAVVHNATEQNPVKVPLKVWKR